MNKLTELLIDKNDAYKQIRKRIDIGIEIIKYITSSEYNAADSHARYKVWNTYNEELLQRIFDTDKFYKEYSLFVAIPYGVFKDLPKEDVKETKIKEINKKLLKLESIFQRLELIPEAFVMAQKFISTENRKIFIVHGHDEGIKHGVARFVEKFGLEAVILSEQPSSGKTIIEKFEAHSEVGYAIVLLTPDDLTFSVEKQGMDRERARQNVIFELGYFYGKLGRGKVCLIHKGNVEIPSDLSGVVYEKYEGNWQLNVAKEIKSSGISIDLNKLFG